MVIRKLKHTQLLAAFGLLVAVVAPVLIGSSASAADLTQVMVRFDRMKAATATTGTVCAKSGSTGQSSVTVNIPGAYTVGALGTWATSTTNLAWPATASPWPSIGASASGVVGNAVTFSSGALSAGTLYCFNWANSTSVTVGAAGTYTGTVSTNIDSATTYTTVAIADDQIQVSATVPQTFSFALNANSDALGVLSTGSVAQTTGVTATINTNAKNGYRVWAKDTNGGLNSTSASKLIASVNGPLVAGTEGHNLGVTVAQGGGSGTPTATAPFAGGAAGVGGALSSTALAEIGSSGGTASSAVFTLKNSAAISGITPAATDYSDIITVVGAGLF